MPSASHPFSDGRLLRLRPPFHSGPEEPPSAVFLAGGPNTPTYPATATATATASLRRNSVSRTLQPQPPSVATTLPPAATTPF
ncbi:hypothetical protein BV20DRAFT_969470 [Pilatotrama ljubarskyi]|nr:hypothetical protein BV20DRAFT_969470 [Pilatotrama ljubarskyi]